MSLAIRELTVERETCPVVDRVSITAGSGEVTALIGPNGAGKSTLLKAVLGLLPSRGGLQWNGADLRAMSPAERARTLAYVPQRSLLAAAMPVQAVVAAGRFAHQGWLGGPRADDATAVASALAAVDATRLAHRAFNALSAGEQQRVLVARALASGAPCILMDEPTSSLDVGHGLDLLALIRRLAAEGRAVVVVLHQLDDARRIADRTVLMHRGRILAEGGAGTVFADGPLAEAFRVVPQPGAAMGFAPLEGRP